MSKADYRSIEERRQLIREIFELDKRDREIYQKLQAGERQVDVAEEFNLNQSTISYIKKKMEGGEQGER